MRLGYPCINRSLGVRTDRTFRLASYSDDLFREVVRENLAGLAQVLDYNCVHNLLFFRISSETIPFGSHAICRVDWAKEFKKELASLGDQVRAAGMRISMHPDQFVLINAKDPKIVERSIGDLEWHERLLSAMELGSDAKIQIHVGGIYGDKSAAMKCFEDNYRRLPEAIRRRLVIENDDRLYSLADCLQLHEAVGVPILFDTFHHACLNNGEPLSDAIKVASATWTNEDGPLMIDYSSQKKGARLGAHAEHIDESDFRSFLKTLSDTPSDLILEIKDKEISALVAASLARPAARRHHDQSD